MENGRNRRGMKMEKGEVIERRRVGYCRVLNFRSADFQTW
jgi:hypothetical protein